MRCPSAMLCSTHAAHLTAACRAMCVPPSCPLVYIRLNHLAQNLSAFLPCLCLTLIYLPFSAVWLTLYLAAVWLAPACLCTFELPASSTDGCERHSLELVSARTTPAPKLEVWRGAMEMACCSSTRVVRYRPLPSSIRRVTLAVCGRSN